MGSMIPTIAELLAPRDAPDQRQLDAMQAYLRWVRTVLPTLAACALVVVWAWTGEDALLRAAAVLALSGVIVGSLLLLVVEGGVLGIARAVWLSAYLDVLIIAAASAQVADVAIVAPSYVWSIAVCAAFCAPRDTLAVTLLGVLAAVASSIAHGYDESLTLVLDALGLLIIGSLLAMLQVGQHRAVAARHRLEQQLQEAQELAHIGSWEWNTETGVRRWSPEMYRIFGRAEGSELGPDALFEAIVPDDRARVQARIDAGLDEHGVIDFDASIERPDGTVRAIHVIGTASRVDPDRLMVGSVQDVTELRRLDRLRDEFVAAASHELRTPTSIILGFASTLEERWDVLAEQERRQFVGQIELAARRLSLLIEDVLQVSHIESGHIHCEREPIELTSVLAEISSDWPGSSPIDLRCSGDVVAVTDALRVRQIITNLLTNAARYSSGSDPIVVTVFRRGSSAVIAVRDDGPGVSLADQERIFERFVRLEHDGSGTGLGLYISRRLAQALGGSLDVDSAPGRGSTFSLSLPLASG